MCRILAVKSIKPIRPIDLLHKFADMSKNSRTLDDDRQEDGWGFTWLDEKKDWQTYKSLSAIWTPSELDNFEKFPKTKIFLAHARSATFKSQVGEIDFNQPFVNENLAFAFNGHLEGVRLNRPVKGRIGAEKIWSLTQEYASRSTTLPGLLRLQKTIWSNTDKVHGMNVVVSDKFDIYGLCGYTHNEVNPSYYQMQIYTTHNLKFISSEKLCGYDTTGIGNGDIIVL